MCQFHFFADADTDYCLSLFADANANSKFCADADIGFLNEFSMLNY